MLRADSAASGLLLSVMRYLPFEVSCRCGHRTRYQPPRAAVPAEWQDAGVDRQQLLGPRLAAVVLLLSLRYRLSRAKVQELLGETLGLDLSIGLIDQTVRQSAGQIAPIEQSPVPHVDGTVWPEAGASLWFWVFRLVNTVLYLIGSRAKEMFVNALPEGFTGLLLTDGDSVNRHYDKRLRC